MHAPIVCKSMVQSSTSTRHSNTVTLCRNNKNTQYIVILMMMMMMMMMMLMMMLMMMMLLTTMRLLVISTGKYCMYATRKRQREEKERYVQS